MARCNNELRTIILLLTVHQDGAKLLKRITIYK
ncbi:MAG: hypothetical protein Gaeavirus8_4 [Gaeavirus sp.]|uniref:Uncharacterized protein n=1 Tax=Gaeavirus sp. TaxID=2487767 RepID=A0A3G5A2L4_9VIRU|nr:MAG: hypothetical protein Gaeavirus8_4 [Gaeavirus sp.]